MMQTLKPFIKCTQQLVQARQEKNKLDQINKTLHDYDFELNALIQKLENQRVKIIELMDTEVSIVSSSNFSEMANQLMNSVSIEPGNPEA